jgi:flagellar hook-associated protein 1
MSDLFSALDMAAHSLDVLQQAMGVIQTNVANASTPGYVTQSLNLSATTFQSDNNSAGGVQADGIQSARNQYAEQSVWNQNELLGAATAQSSSLSSLQSVFDVSGTSGIPAALSSLSSAFSAWSTSPTDATSRQQVLNAAQSVSQAFQQAATSVTQIQSQTDQQLKSTVDQINQLTSQIASLNQQIRNGDTNDPGLQANLYNDLEQLSNLTSISAQVEGDGTVTVLMSGETPLVIGGTQTQLQVQYVGSAGFPPPQFGNASPDVKIETASGQDVTSIVSEGQLAALVQFRNTTLPSVIGGQNQQGSLNQLAQAIADKVNSLLTSGQTSSGTSGVPLFSYSSNPVNSYVSLAGNSENLNTPGATFITGSTDQTFTFNLYDSTSGQAKQVTATLSHASGPYTASSAISTLNTQLEPYGISAFVDSNGQLAFTGSTAFTVSDSNNSGGVTGALTNYSANSVANAGTAENTSNYIVDSGKYTAITAGTETLTFTPSTGNPINVTLDPASGDTPDDAIAAINKQTAGSGIYAVKNDAGGISFQSASSFTISDQIDSAGKASGTGVFGTASTTAATFYPQPPSSTSVAASLSVNPNITASQLAAVQPASGSNTAVANGIASQLAQLANSSSDINGMTFADFYSGIASNIGTQASNASTEQQTQTELLAQAQNMRAQVSGVSLNDQAAQLVQFQQAYEAQSEMIQVITSMNNYLMQSMQSVS